MSNRKPQHEKILDFCRAHGYITVRDAVLIGVGSLTKRISEMMRSPEYEIAKRDVPVLDDDGRQVTHYVQYWVKEVGT